ncbi:hypothetical protein GQR58_007245 [Nymphon striatum]|nr:hypothetical protein GQR58_007245 [Nymphon striatum]
MWYLVQPFYFIFLFVDLNWPKFVLEDCKMVDKLMLCSIYFLGKISYVSNCKEKFMRIPNSQIGAKLRGDSGIPELMQCYSYTTNYCTSFLLLTLLHQCDAEYLPDVFNLYFFIGEILIELFYIIFVSSICWISSLIGNFSPSFTATLCWLFYSRQSQHAVHTNIKVLLKLSLFVVFIHEQSQVLPLVLQSNSSYNSPSDLPSYNADKFYTGLTEDKHSVEVDPQTNVYFGDLSEVTSVTDYPTGGVIVVFRCPDHLYPTKNETAKASKPGDMPADRALAKLNDNNFERLGKLFRNAHAIVKNCCPMTDFTWMAKLDKAKDVDIGETYLNDKSCKEIIVAIAESTRHPIEQLLENHKLDNVEKEIKIQTYEDLRKKNRREYHQQMANMHNEQPTKNSSNETSNKPIPKQENSVDWKNKYGDVPL